MTANFETLDALIDRTAEAESLSPAEMQSHLIRLYRNYVSEWDTVESRIAADFLEKDSEGIRQSVPPQSIGTGP